MREACESRLLGHCVKRALLRLDGLAPAEERELSKSGTQTFHRWNVSYPKEERLRRLLHRGHSQEGKREKHQGNIPLPGGLLEILLWKSLGKL